MLSSGHDWCGLPDQYVFTFTTLIDFSGNETLDFKCSISTEICVINIVPDSCEEIWNYVFKKLIVNFMNLFHVSYIYKKLVKWKLMKNVSKVLDMFSSL